MRKTYVLIFTTFILITISMGYIHTNNFEIKLDPILKYEISTDKSEYIEGEDIYLTFKLTCTKGKCDSGDSWGQDVIQGLEITNQNGAVAHNRFNAHSDRKFETPILKSDDTVSFSDNINGNFDFLTNKNISFLSHYFVAGEYSVIGIIKVNGEYIKSNDIKFTVVTPPDSEYIPFTKKNELGNIQNIYYEDKQFRQISHSLVDSSIQFLQKFPKSVYVFPVYNFYFSLSQVINYKWDERLYLISKIIFDHPENMQSMLNLRNIIPYAEMIFNDEKVGFRILDSLRTTVNNPKLSAAIDKIIKEKQK